MIELPYHGNTISMLIVVPSDEDTSLSSVIPHISTATVQSWAKLMHMRKVRLFIPKFSADAEVDLKAPLSALGIADMFMQGAADFSHLMANHRQRKSLSVVEVWKQGCYLCEVRKVVKAGLRVILASPWYLDQPGPTHNWARYYNVWPLAFKGTEKQKRLVIGGEVCLWGEYVDATNLSPRLWCV
ncbi:hypothetical protein GOODEAATRI_021370 [Goodea atripinnis]|uniref:Serpin domain-containing protein n=1 Tax=Goodea atripinnis TaxID=208336 RepID=A0ABV0N373_9TELE